MEDSRRTSRRKTCSTRESSSNGGSKGSDADSSGGLRDFKALLSAVMSPEGLKSAALKDLYHILLRLTSGARWSAENIADSRDFDLKICHDGVEFTFGDVCKLSNVLFKELDERFGKLFSNLCGISAGKDGGESSSSLDLFDAFEVIIFLFRCCLLLLVLLGSRQNHIVEKGRVLCRILRKLSLANVVENTRKHEFVIEKSVFHECASANHDCSTSLMEDLTASLQFLEPCNCLYFFVSTILEVFIDELLVHSQLRGYFKIINYVASFNEMQFNTNSCKGDIAIVMEAISNHFIQSFSDTHAFGDFCNRLFCMRDKELTHPFGTPMMGITSAVSLFLTPVTATAPKYMQAHLFSLVSEAIDIKSLKLDRKVTNCFLSAFEKSVALYMRHMSSLQTYVYSIGDMDVSSGSSCNIALLPFELYILPETKCKVDSLVAKLDSAADQILQDCCFKMKSDLVSSSMRFIKECQNRYVISCEDEVLTILSCLVLKASECYDGMQPIKRTSLQHIYLLASLLRVMSISLIQAIRCLRHSDDICSPKTLEDFSSCKEYDFIMGILVCFRDLDASLPLQKVLSSLILDHSVRHRDSKMMFLHFWGLMSLSFAGGIDCLVKACLLTILALLNLFIFEEGNLNVLQSFVDFHGESFSLELPIVRFQETVVNQNTSLVVASRFQKIRSLYSSSKENKCDEIEESMSLQASAGAEKHTEAVSYFEEETEETSSGEIFLKCMLRPGQNVPDFDDLASFIECKHGKDYSDWLKNREKYRKWKSEKMAVLKWKKKKKIQKSLKVNRN